MANTYLTRTVSSGADLTKWTWSCWVKRTDLVGGGNGCQRIISNEVSGNNKSWYIRFQPNGEFHAWSNNGAFEFTTTTKYRDVNGWYHFVIKYDSTQSTESNRFKVYVNGEQPSMSNIHYPTLNETVNFMNTGNYIDIGYYRQTPGEYFFGLLSHMHFTAGYAYDASAFGSTDATTGEWKINASPSVTYGSLGFFILKDGNTITDSSPNSNNFSLGGGTLTKTEDCPSNVFNTWNPLDNLQEVGTFYNGNATYQTGTANGKYSRNTTTLGMTSGKFYWEVKPATVNTGIDYYPFIGITASQITGTQDWVGKASTDYSWGTNQDGSDPRKYNNGSGTSWGNHFALNSIVGVAVDLDNNKIYFSKNGVWQESGDPTSGSTGTGSAFTITSASSTPLGAYFPSLSNYDGTGYVKFEANFGNGYFGTTAVSSAGSNASGIGIFEYDVPTGYTALSTKGLNL